LEKVILIATAGFVILSVYRIYFKTQFNEQNTYETLFTCLIYGLLPYSFYHIFHLIPFPPSLPEEYLFLESEEFHEIYKVINALASTSISIILICLIPTGKWIVQFKSWLSNISDHKMDLNMMSEKEFHGFQRGFKKVFFQLTDGKVLIGFIKFADYSDSVPTDLRIVRVQVLKSGDRNKTDSSKINFNVNYDELAIEKLYAEQFQKYGEKWQAKYINKENELENLQKVKINKFAPTYSIFQREIKYYSLFDQEIHNAFQKEDDK